MLLHSLQNNFESNRLVYFDVPIWTPPVMAQTPEELKAPVTTESHAKGLTIKKFKEKSAKVEAVIKAITNESKGGLKESNPAAQSLQKSIEERKKDKFDDLYERYHSQFNTIAKASDITDNDEWQQLQAEASIFVQDVHARLGVTDGDKGIELDTKLVEKEANFRHLQEQYENPDTVGNVQEQVMIDAVKLVLQERLKDKGVELSDDDATLDFAKYIVKANGTVENPYNPFKESGESGVKNENESYEEFVARVGDELDKDSGSMIEKAVQALLKDAPRYGDQPEGQRDYFQKILTTSLTSLPVGVDKDAVITALSERFIAYTTTGVRMSAETSAALPVGYYVDQFSGYQTHPASDIGDVLSDIITSFKTKDAVETFLDDFDTHQTLISDHRTEVEDNRWGFDKGGKVTDIESLGGESGEGHGSLEFLMKESTAMKAKVATTSGEVKKEGIALGKLKATESSYNKTVQSVVGSVTGSGLKLSNGGGADILPKNAPKVKIVGDVMDGVPKVDFTLMDVQGNKIGSILIDMVSSPSILRVELKGGYERSFPKPTVLTDFLEKHGVGEGVVRLDELVASNTDKNQIRLNAIKEQFRPSATKKMIALGLSLGDIPVSDIKLQEDSPILRVPIKGSKEPYNHATKSLGYVTINFADLKVENKTVNPDQTVVQITVLGRKVKEPCSLNEVHSNIVQYATTPTNGQSEFTKAIESHDTQKAAYAKALKSMDDGLSDEYKIEPLFNDRVDYNGVSSATPFAKITHKDKTLKVNVSYNIDEGITSLLFFIERPDNAPHSSAQEKADPNKLAQFVIANTESYFPSEVDEASETDEATGEKIFTFSSIELKREGYKLPVLQKARAKVAGQMFSGWLKDNISLPNEFGKDQSFNLSEITADNMEDRLVGKPKLAPVLSALNHVVNEMDPKRLKEVIAGTYELTNEDKVKFIEGLQKAYGLEEKAIEEVDKAEMEAIGNLPIKGGSDETFLSVFNANHPVAKYLSMKNKFVVGKGGALKVGEKKYTTATELAALLPDGSEMKTQFLATLGTDAGSDRDALLTTLETAAGVDLKQLETSKVVQDQFLKMLEAAKLDPDALEDDSLFSLLQLIMQVFKILKDGKIDAMSQLPEMWNDFKKDGGRAAMANYKEMSNRYEDILQNPSNPPTMEKLILAYKNPSGEAADKLFTPEGDGAKPLGYSMRRQEFIRDHFSKMLNVSDPTIETTGVTNMVIEGTRGKMKVQYTLNKSGSKWQVSRSSMDANDEWQEDAKFGIKPFNGHVCVDQDGKSLAQVVGSKKNRPYTDPKTETADTQSPNTKVKPEISADKLAKKQLGDLIGLLKNNSPAIKKTLQSITNKVGPKDFWTRNTGADHLQQRKIMKTLKATDWDAQPKCQENLDTWRTQNIQDMFTSHQSGDIKITLTELAGFMDTAGIKTTKAIVTPEEEKAPAPK